MEVLPPVEPIRVLGSLHKGLGHLLALVRLLQDHEGLGRHDVQEETLLARPHAGQSREDLHTLHGRAGPLGVQIDLPYALDRVSEEVHANGHPLLGVPVSGHHRGEHVHDPAPPGELARQIDPVHALEAVVHEPPDQGLRGQVLVHGQVHGPGLDRVRPRGGLADRLDRRAQHALHRTRAAPDRHAEALRPDLVRGVRQVLLALPRRQELGPLDPKGVQVVRGLEGVIDMGADIENGPGQTGGQVGHQQRCKRAPRALDPEDTRPCSGQTLNDLQDNRVPTQVYAVHVHSRFCVQSLVLLGPAITHRPQADKGFPLWAAGKAVGWTS